MVSSYWENIIQAPGSVRKIQIKNAIFFPLNASESWLRKAVKCMLKSVCIYRDRFLPAHLLTSCTAGIAQLTSFFSAVSTSSQVKWKIY